LALKGLVSIATSDQLRMRRYQLSTGKIKWWAGGAEGD